MYCTYCKVYTGTQRQKSSKCYIHVHIIYCIHDSFCYRKKSTIQILHVTTDEEAESATSTPPPLPSPICLPIQHSPLDIQPSGSSNDRPLDIQPSGSSNDRPLVASPNAWVYFLFMRYKSNIFHCEIHLTISERVVLLLRRIFAVCNI